MAKIKNYLRFKEKEKTDGPGTEYREKIKGYGWKSLLKWILVTLAAGVMVFLLLWRADQKEYTESMITESVPVPRVEGAVSMQLGNAVFTYSKDGANCTLPSGVVLWNQTYQMQNPMVEIGRNIVAIGDYNGRVIYIMDEKGIKGQVSTNLPIRKFCVAENGVVAVILDDSRITRINLYDSTGNELVQSETAMNKSGYPLDITLSPNGQLLGISYFYADSGKMKSTIAFHNFGEVGQNISSDRFVSGYDYQNSVVPFLSFMNNHAVFAVSDDRLMFFEGEEKPVSVAEKLLDEKVQSVFYGKEYVGLVMLDTTGGGKYRLDLYDEKGNLKTSKSFDMEYTNIILEKDYFIIYNGNEYCINNMQGKERFREAFHELTYLMMPLEKKHHFLIVTQTGLKTMVLK